MIGEGVNLQKNSRSGRGGGRDTRAWREGINSSSESLSDSYLVENNDEGDDANKISKSKARFIIIPIRHWWRTG